METPAAPVASTPATTSCADAPADRVERVEPVTASLILGPGVSFEVRA